MAQVSSKLLLPQVLDRLGLRTQPFGSVHGDQLFVSPGLKMQLDMLRHNLVYSDLLQLLLGEPASGKSTLLSGLLAELSSDHQVFMLAGTTELNAESLVAHMISQYQLALDSLQPAPLQTLLDEMLKYRRQNVPLALIIDNAHRVPVEQLQAIMKVVDELNRALDDGLHLLLLGEPELERMTTRISSLQISAGKVFSSTIRPLPQTESEQYLLHRLRLAGYGGASPFSAQELQQMHQQSGGYPGRLEQAAATLLNRTGEVAPAEKKRRIKLPAIPRLPWLPRLHWLTAAVALAVTLLITGLVWLLPPENEPVRQVQLTVPEKLPGGPAKAASGTTPLAANEAAAEHRQAESPPKTVSGANPAPPADAPNESVPADSEPAGALPATGSVPAATAATEAEAEAEAEAATVQAAAVTLPGDTAAPVKPAGHSAATEVPAELVPKPVISAEKAADGRKLPIPPDFRDQDWLLAQPGQKYMLQLLALHDLQPVLDYAAGHSLSGDKAVFRTTHRGRDWYVLLYQVVPDLEAGHAALRRLPRSLRRSGPWVRSLASVQQAIKDSGN